MWCKCRSWWMWIVSWLLCCWFMFGRVWGFGMLVVSWMLFVGVNWSGWSLCVCRRLGESWVGVGWVCWFSSVFVYSICGIYRLLLFIGSVWRLRVLLVCWVWLLLWSICFMLYWGLLSFLSLCLRIFIIYSIWWLWRLIILSLVLLWIVRSGGILRVLLVCICWWRRICFICVVVWFFSFICVFMRLFIFCLSFRVFLLGSWLWCRFFLGWVMRRV